MIIVHFAESLKKLFHTDTKREKKTRGLTRRMIKKYSKTLRKLSYE